MGDRDDPAPVRPRGVLRRVFHADGADRSGLAALSYVTIANFACDAVLAVALANTLFFSAATAESRGRVALYLAVTVAPFALVAPVIGPALDRMRRGRRLTIRLTFLARAVLAVLLALNFDSWPLYPLALAMMVLSKTFGVVKAAVTPHVLPPALDLVRTNARLTVLGHVVGSVVAGGVAGGLAWVWDSPTTLWFLVVVALGGAWLSRGLPAHAEAVDGEETATLTYSPEAGATGAGRSDDERRDGERPDAGRPAGSTGPDERWWHVRVLRRVLTRPLGRDVLANLWAVSAARLLTGFLTLYLAFVAKATVHETATGQATMLAAAGVAAGVGTFAGSTVGARLPLGAPSRITLTAAASGVVAAAVAAGLDSPVAALALAAIAAVASALGKVALDASIQTDIPDSARSSAFGRSETALQLAWVAGGALGVLLPPDYVVGFGVVAALGAVLVAQAVLTSRGTSLVPGLGGDRPRRPDSPADPRSFAGRLVGRMKR